MNYVMRNGDNSEGCFRNRNKHFKTQRRGGFSAIIKEQCKS